MNDTAARSERRTARPGAAAIAAAALCAALYLPVLAALARQWIVDPNYQHGIAVPIVSAFFVWRRRGVLRSSDGGGGAAAGWAIVAFASALLVAGTAAAELFTARVSLPLMLIGVLLIFRGAAFVRSLAFPLLFLFMMIPLPYIVYYRLTFPMQLMSAKLAAAVLQGAGVEVIRRGNILVLPNYTLEVVAACSGLRSLMTLVTLSLVLCAVSGLGNRRRAILAASSVPIAIAANTIRLALTAIGARAAGPAFADGILHEISGLIVFGSGFVMLLLVWGVLAWQRGKKPHTAR
jgi:exosortase